MATVVVVVARVVAIVVLVEAGSVGPDGLVALGLKDCGDIQCEN